jgi:quercetin dioxygenase-like cupin family protein
VGEPREFYNLNDRAQGQLRQLACGVSARVFLGDHSMLSVVTFKPNREGEIHSHPEEQWGVLLEGDGVRTQAGEEHLVKAGDFWRTPAGVPHGFRAGADGAYILDIFSPPREAYKKPGAGLRARVIGPRT